MWGVVTHEQEPNSAISDMMLAEGDMETTVAIYTHITVLV